jgi:hypothetical protein
LNATDLADHLNRRTACSEVGAWDACEDPLLEVASSNTDVTVGDLGISSYDDRSCTERLEHDVFGIAFVEELKTAVLDSLYVSEDLTNIFGEGEAETETGVVEAGPSLASCATDAGETKSRRTRASGARRLTLETMSLGESFNQGVPSSANGADMTVSADSAIFIAWHAVSMTIRVESFLADSALV